MEASGGRCTGLLAVTLAVAGLFVAGPTLGARFVLVNLDDPGEGFNDPAPVGAVIGNPATTLGGQRVRVFEAATWRLGVMIASPVEIRVEASWDSLECSAREGTLASAGPSFVFRDFPSAPRSGTWYAGALAEAIAGEGLGNDDPDDGRRASMSITFNKDVGTASCLTTRQWDYRIGVAGSAFNMEKVLFHELGHGINFTTFVDHETGGKFQGFDDAYMVHLEDHTTGKRWSAMGNGQRRASITRTGNLHWLGGNAVAHGVRLRGGVHAASSHPQMYAPDPAEGGSSVAHWDTSVDRNVNEFMEPFATSSSTDLVTSHLYQDLGWSVNRSGVDWLEDQNGNESVEIAVLQVAEGLAGHEVVLLDTGTGELVRRIPLPAGYAALDLVVVPHHSGSPASEIAVLLWRVQGSAVSVVQFDASTGEEVARFPYPSGSPMRLAVAPDFVGSAASELMVLGLRAGTGARVWIKDAMTGMMHSQLTFPRQERPVDLALLDSFGGSNAPEIAVLLAIPERGTSEVKVHDGRSRARLARHQLPTGQVYQFIRALSDFGGAVGVGELAVASIDGDTGRPRLLVFDGSGGEILSSKTFQEAFVPTSLEVLPSFAGTMADELVLWTRRQGHLKPRGFVLDGASMASLGGPSLGNKHLPRAMAVLPNIGRSPAPDTVVVTAASRDRLQRAFLIDGRGRQIRTLILP
jgi:hypothetical protein